jgi:hypothetical protein
VLPVKRFDVIGTPATLMRSLLSSSGEARGTLQHRSRSNYIAEAHKTFGFDIVGL